LAYERAPTMIATPMAVKVSFFSMKNPVDNVYRTRILTMGIALAAVFREIHH
jgi:hypothetical protein